MNFKTSLDRIWKSYQITEDCLKITQRTVSKDEKSMLKGTAFLNSSSEDESEEWIRQSRTDANDYVILSLWAAFERIILEYLQKKGRKILDKNSSDFNKKFYKKIEQEIEYWKINDILDMFKEIIDPNLIGNAKQIKQYRDWVAHRNIDKGSPANVAPQSAYQILSEILTELDNIA